jgi:hypothetical protein
VLVAIFLVGGASPQERMAREVDSARATCLAVGFKDGTQEMATCTMMNVQQAQAAAADARRQAVFDASIKLLQQNNRPPQPVTWCNWSELALIGLPDEVPARTIARCLTDPATSAAGTLNALYRNVSTEGDVNGYIAELQHQAQAVSAGNLSQSEAMLMSQATTLNALFHSLTGWA